MRRVSHHVAAVVVMVCFTSFAAAQDIATFSDVQLIEETREAVGAQDAEAALDLLTEMQRRGTGIFAAALSRELVKPEKSNFLKRPTPPCGTADRQKRVRSRRRSSPPVVRCKSRC